MANVTRPEIGSQYRVQSITSAQVDGRHYALLITRADITIIDITIPASPSTVATLDVDLLIDNDSLVYFGRDTVTTGGRHYVPVTSVVPGFFAMLDITDPANPAFGRAGGPPVFDELDDPTDIDVIEIDGIPYALVSAYGDDGVQIINMSDPSYPVPAAGLTDGEGGFEELEGSNSIAAAKIGERYYALVVAYDDRGIQIIDITDPANPSPEVAITNAMDGFGAMNFPRYVAVTEIDGAHYALVSGDSAFHVINVTDPGSPAYVVGLTDGQDGFSLSVPNHIALANINGTTYAMVSVIIDNSLQMIDLSDPANPAAAAAFANRGAGGVTILEFTDVDSAEIGDSHYVLAASPYSGGIQIINIANPDFLYPTATFTESLEAPQAAEFMESGGAHYALVVDLLDDGTGSLAVINVTDPARPSLVANVTGGKDSFGAFSYPHSISVMESRGAIYALILYSGDGMAVIDVTDPANPFNSLLPHLKLDLEGGRAVYAGQEDGGQSMMFRYLTTPDDHTVDLSYEGTGALHLGRAVLSYVDDGLPVSAELPEPGKPDSLSYEKQIRLYGTDPADHFITTWEVPAGGQITFPGSGNYILYWGDGDHMTGATGPVSHTYEHAGTYTVEAAGDLRRINLGTHPGSAALLRSVEQWGSTAWTSMAGAFQGAAKMVHNADDSPDLSGVAGAARMFQGAALFDGDLDSWDVSAVEDMSNMFRDASSFDGDLDSWNVSSATDMSGMFDGASSFDDDLSSWDVSWVTDMSNMFRGATSFDQNLGNWYVTLDSDTIVGTGIPGVVGTISAQNLPLKNHSPTYGIVDDDDPDADHFEILSGNRLNMTSGVPGKAEYSINVTASGGNVFESGNNWRLLEIEVIDQTTDTKAPVITLEGSNHVSITIGDMYSDEGATCDDNVDASRVLTPSGTVDTSTVGSYVLTYSCTDAAGNAATQVTRTVNVKTPVPTFISSELATETGVLRITFSETIDATNVVAAKIHIRESGSYAGGITLTTGELGTTTDASTISFTLTEQHRTAVTGLRAPELTIEPGAVQDTSGNLIVGTFDLSTASYDGEAERFSVSEQEIYPSGVAFSNNGVKMFVVGDDGNDINEYTLSTPFDVSTAAFANVTFSVLAQDPSPSDVAFSNDGAKMFVVGWDGNGIHEYALDTPFDLSTAAFANVTFHVSEQETKPQGMAFSNDGAKMFVIGDVGNDINEYTLDTPFDLSTAEFAHVTFNVSKQETKPQGMAFSNDGAKMFIVGLGGNINEYTLSTPFNVATAAFAHSFYIFVQDALPTGMAFSNDGAKMFVVGWDGEDINEYTLSSVYPIVSDAAAPVQVTSDTPDGDYGPGTKIDVRLDFAEPVGLDIIPVADSQPVLQERFHKPATFQADGRHYAVLPIDNIRSSGDPDAVEIVDITDPNFLRVVARMENSTDFLLGEPVGVDMASIGGYQYAIVATFSEQLHIINVTDPENPSTEGMLLEVAEELSDFSKLYSGLVFQIGNYHYALVPAILEIEAAHFFSMVNITDPGNPSVVSVVPDNSGPFAGFNAFSPGSNLVQIGGHHYAVVPATSALVMLNITDPANLTYAGSARSGQGGFGQFSSGQSAVVEVDGHHYALIGSTGTINKGLTIINITDPASLSYVANVTRPEIGSQYRVQSVTSAQVDGRHYALLITRADITIIDITIPASPSTVATLDVDLLIDNDGLSYFGRDTVTTGGRHYVPVTSVVSGFFAMLDITDPANPAFGRAGGPPVFDELDNPNDIDVIEIGGIHYALVAALKDDGVQIINMSDPSYPVPVAGLTDGEGGFDTLDGSISIAATKIGERYYALVAASEDRGIQIIDITDPANPLPKFAVTNATDGFGAMEYPAHIEVTKIGSAHYALVSDYSSVFHVINVTDPGSPAYVTGLTDGEDGLNLEVPEDFALANIDGTTYAIVNVLNDHRLQMIDLSDPANPVAAGFAGNDADGFGIEFDDVASAEIGRRHYALAASAHTENIQIIDVTNPDLLYPTATFTESLDTPQAVEFMESGGAHYALVVDILDNGASSLVVINVTDPTRPSLVANVTGGKDGLDAFSYPYFISVMESGGAVYALILYSGDGMAVIDVTDPANPFNSFLPHLKLDLEGGRAVYAGQEDGGQSMMFQYLTTPDDHTVDLSYEGTGALHLGRAVLSYVDDGLPVSAELPEPGKPDSLSYEKQIRLYGTDPADHFITTWEVPAGGQITFPGSGNYILYWGDGDHVTGATDPVSHTYEHAGNYTVEAAGDLRRINLGTHPGSAALLRSVEQWGSTAWTSMAGAFQGAAKMVHNADDSPDLSEVISAARMFQGAALFDGDLDSWDVSAVEDMSNMFRDASSFDGDLDSWNVSSAIDMSDMFRGASTFDDDLSSWDVSWVTDMLGMFRGANSFDQNLGNWYVVPADITYATSEGTLNVTTISAQNTFLDDRHSPSYGIGSDSNLFNITDSKTLMFKNIPSTGIHTVNVTASGTDVFEDGNNWRLLEIRVANQTIYLMPPVITVFGLNPVYVPVLDAYSDDGATCVDGVDGNLTIEPKSDVDIAVPGTYTVTYSCIDSDGNKATATRTVFVTGDPVEDHFVTTWKTTSDNESITIPTSDSYTVRWGDDAASESVSGLQSHVYTSPGTYTVRIYGGLEAIDLSDNSSNAAKLQSIEQWGAIEWDTMNSAFRGASNMMYNADDAPDLSGVTDMDSMFRGASDFNGNISSWNVSSVENMANMFRDASSFNGNLSGWDVSSVENMATMFDFATSFDQNLGNWYVTLDSNTIAGTAIPGVVGTISAQNQPLKDHSPTYSIVGGPDADHFKIVSGNQLNMTSGVSGRDEYSINVTASGGNVFESGNNWRLLEIKVTGQTTDTESPVITLQGSDTVTITVGDMYGDEGATCKDKIDAAPTLTSSGTVDTSQTGSYTVTYSCTDAAGNAAAQVTRTVNVKTPPPTFVSSELDTVTRVLTITFSEIIDVTPKTNVDAAKIHIRESGNYTGGGITLTAGELVTAADTSTISFNLTKQRLAAVAELDAPELTIEPGAVRDTSGNLIVGSFDVSTASYNGNTEIFSVSGQTNTPTGMAFSNDGAKMFVVGVAKDAVNEYTLSPNFDVSTAIFAHSFNVTEDVIPIGMAFSNDGTKMFVVGDDGNDINEYTLSAPFDVSTTTFAHSFNVTAQETEPQGMAFSNDGTKMFVVGSDGEEINEYDLSTPFDVSTASSANVTFSVLSQDSTPTGMAFSNDGTKMFVVGDAKNYINEYTLSTPFDLSTASYALDIERFDVSGQDRSPQGMAFSNDGTKMFVVGNDGDDINEYTLSSVYPITVTNPPPTFVSSDLDTATGVLTITFSETIDVTPKTNVDAAKIHIRESGNYTGGVTLTADELDTTATTATIAFILTELHYTTVVGMTTPELTIEPGAVQDIFGSLIVGTFDVSTAIYAGNTERFYVGGQDGNPQGMAFSNDGYKMFVIDFTGKDISEYTLSTPFDVSTASYAGFSERFSVGGQDTRPSGMAFSNDGAKMFVVGDFGDHIHEYTLSTPFDVSTASYAGVNARFYVGGQEGIPQGMAFSNDGAKMFVMGNARDYINEYTLSTPFDVSTASYALDNERFYVRDQEETPSGMAFSNDGAKMFVVGIVEDYINEYTLSAPFDVSTASYALDGERFYVGDQEGTPTGMAFSNDGAKMFVVGLDGKDINEYTLSSLYPLRVHYTTPPLTDGAFATTWRTTDTDKSITLQLVGSGMTVNWGDGNTTTVSTSGSVSHTYSTAVDYTIQIAGGLTGFRLNSADASKLVSLDQWGTASWTTMENAFRRATNMVYNADDTPVLSGVASMKNMFDRASSFNGTLSGWAVSSVTDMSGMFWGASDFNQPLSGWDVSKVDDMSSMFRDASSFNGTLSGWDVSKVDDMSHMFNSASDFNQPLSGWDVSSVTNMQEMFISASSFNRDLSSWNVSSVERMSDMFHAASLFEQNLGNWYVTLDSDTIAGTGIPGVVGTISAQNQQLRNHSPTYGIVGGPDMDRFEIVSGNQLNMTSGVPGEYSVNVTASGGNVFESGNNWRLLEIRVIGQITDTTPLTAEAFVTTWWTTTADKSITLPLVGSGMTVNWGDGNTTTASGSVSHTYNTAGDYTVQITGGLTGFQLNDAAYASKLVSLDQWGTTSWTTMENAFRGASNMRYNAADSPDLTSVTDMSDMFRKTSFRGGLSNWNVSSVTDMSYMFAISSFNGNISSWDVSLVTKMSSMFLEAPSFRGDLSNWDVSSVKSMSRMFSGASSFNGNLSNWDVSSVKSMSRMFSGASSFNGNLSSWNVSSVTDMNRMFLFATSFNGDLSSWNVSSVTNMAHMFNGASSFNSDLSSWDVSSAIDMDAMFDGASLFDQNLGEWYVTLDPDTIVGTGIPGVVGTISAQNQPLRDHVPTYGIVADDQDATHFEIISGNRLNMTSGVSGRDEYSINVTASGTDVFENGNNWRVFEIMAPEVRDAKADFVTTWRTNSANQAVTIQVHSSLTYDYTVLWGDDTNSTGLTGDAIHTYAVPDDYQVRIYGTYPGIHLNDHADAFKLISIDRWGSNSWATMESAFDGASLMTYNAIDTPNLSGVTDMSEMFRDASVFNGDLSGWTVSSVTDMSGMFRNTDTFNGDLSGWDVSNATNMTRMFYDADAFNRDIPSWDASKVTDMSEMFRATSDFNGNLSGWTVSSVTDMSEMFRGASDFNGDLSGWTVSSVTDMSEMFRGASDFNGDLSGWTVSSVTDMSGMFRNTDTFNGDLSGWDVSNATNMTRMFHDADAFNRDIPSWDASKVTDMSGMFYDAGNFNGDLSGWTVSSVTDMSGMFHDADAFNQPLNYWDVSNVTDMSGMFRNTDTFNGNISGWDVSKVTDMESMFFTADTFNGNISDWDVSAVTNMSYMFAHALDFDQQLNNWNVSKVTNMFYMFSSADSFNQQLNNWNVSKVTGMISMFHNATSFDQQLNNWNVSAVTDMTSMFRGATSFNQTLNDWNVSAVTTMPNMFRDATAFNQPLNDWDVSKVTNMFQMFRFATSFNQPLSNWNVSAVTSIGNMFGGASSFDQNLGNWYVTLDDTSIDRTAVPGTVGSISAQNSQLKGHEPVYGIGDSSDENHFVISDENKLNMTSVGTKSFYTANITVTGDDVFENGNNWRVFEITVSGRADSPEDFVTTWRTGSANQAVTIPVHSGLTYDYTVIWGDGTNSTGLTGNATHTYAVLGDHEVRIYGTYPGISLNNHADAPKLVSIDQWGSIRWTSMDFAFYGASNMIYNAADTPNLSGVTSASRMFQGAASFDGDISSWNTSSIQSMRSMFSGASSFNQTLNSWDVSKVTDMNNMFNTATAFDQSLNSWDVSKVTDMSSMFAGASSFNQPLNSWDVSKVTDMSSMFFGISSSFDQNLGNWYVVPADTAYATSEGTLNVTTISAQNTRLDGHPPSYGIGIGGNSTLFNITDSKTLMFKSIPSAGTYNVNVTASGMNVFSKDNNWRILNITVTGSANQPPTVTDITGNAAINEGASGTLTGTATDGDGTVSSYSWSVNNTSAVTIATGNAAILQYMALQVDSDTAVAFTLTVTDDDGATGSGTYDVTINNLANQPPTVTDITGNAAINEGASGTLTGTATDGDGTVSSYSWSVNNTSAVTIATGNAAILQYMALQVDSDTAVAFTLTVTDDDGATGSGTYDVTINNLANQPPTVTDITGNAAINEGASGTLTGTATDGDGTVSSYSWSVNNTSAVTIATGNAAILQYMALQVDSDTAVAFTLTVTDDDGATGSGTYDVTINNLAANQPPTDGAFVTTWRTATDSDEITLPISGSDMTVYWGDGNTTAASGSVSYTYGTAGNYTIQITGGLTGFQLNGAADASKLISIDRWGTASWTTMESAFWGASNMAYNATDSPNLSSVTDMSGMFRSASSFNGNISDWVVSSVTDTSHMFDNASSFNGTLSGWDVSSVEKMASMFYDASDFSQPLSDWVVSSVTDMNSMFRGASSFNSDISGWDVSKVTSISDMFHSASLFDQNLGNWYVVPADITYAISEGTLIVTTISAQGTALDDQTPLYGIGIDSDSDGNSNLFNITNSNTLMFKGDPSAGTYNVNVTASGTNVFENGNNWRVFEVRVSDDINALPMLTAIGPKSVNEMVLLEFNATATDTDSNSLEFSLGTGFPSGASITSAGEFSWTPTERQDGTSSITVKVSDNKNGTASETITVTVNEMNTAPVLDAIASKDVTRPNTLTFTATASDDDYRGNMTDTVTFSLTGTPLLSGASITSAGDFSWTPAAGQTGQHGVTVTVTDGTSLTDSKDVVITVNTPSTTNTPPTVDAGPDRTVNERTAVTLSGSASDPDGDTMTYAWTHDSGISVDLTGSDTTRPQFTAPGVTSNEDIVFTFTVTDTAGESADDTITVTVRDVPISVLSATYNPGNGQLIIAFNQDIGPSAPDYSAMHIRSTGSDSGGIALSGVTASHTGRTITATLDSEQQEEYGDLDNPQLDIAGGAVTDVDGVLITQMSNIPISDASRKSTSSSSSSKAPAVHINALVQARIIDIPPHIAEQAASHDASDPLESITPDGTFDFPLVINGYGYLLDDVTNTLVPQILTVGDDDPTIITFTVYTQKDLAHFALYLNLQGENTNYADSDTYITYKNDDGTTSVIDPHGYIGNNATITVTQEDDSVPERKTVRITVEFGEEPMGPTNMVAYMWNTDRKAAFIKIIDAFGVAAALLEPVVQAADPEPLEPDSVLPADPEPVAPDLAGDVVDPEPVSSDMLWPDDYDEAQTLHIIRMWSGFESEFITDTQMLDLLGLEDYQDVDLPSWMMTELGVLVAKGDVTVDEFMLALQYMLTYA